MKLSVPSPRAILLGFKTLVFHPMLYGAILMHWAVFQIQMPTPEAEEPTLDELLEDSVTIAQANTLKKAPPKLKPVEKKAAPQPKPEKPKAAKPKQVAKPKPLAQALAKTTKEEPPKPKATPNPEEEAKAKAAREKEAELKAKEEELKAKEEALKVEEAKAKENTPENLEEENQENEEETENNEDTENNEEETGANEETPAHLQALADANPFGGSEQEQSVDFNIQLLPQPELVFTAESIAAYQSLEGDLEQLPGVFKVDWWKNRPKDIAINDFKEKFSSYEISDLDDYAGGSLFQMVKGEEVIYASLINNPKKRTLKSSTVFIIWKANPAG